MAAKTKKGSTFDILDIDYEKQICNFVPRKGKNTSAPTWECHRLLGSWRAMTLNRWWPAALLVQSWAVWYVHTLISLNHVFLGLLLGLLRSTFPSKGVVKILFFRLMWQWYLHLRFIILTRKVLDVPSWDNVSRSTRRGLSKLQVR